MGPTATTLLVAIRTAVNEACTCGGAGPGEGCPACEVWHYIQRVADVDLADWTPGVGCPGRYYSSAMLAPVDADHAEAGDATVHLLCDCWGLVREAETYVPVAVYSSGPRAYLSAPWHGLPRGHRVGVLCAACVRRRDALDTGAAEVKRLTAEVERLRARLGEVDEAGAPLRPGRV